MSDSDGEHDADALMHKIMQSATGMSVVPPTERVTPLPWNTCSGMTVDSDDDDDVILDDDVVIHASLEEEEEEGRGGEVGGGDYMDTVLQQIENRQWDWMLRDQDVVDNVGKHGGGEDHNVQYTVLSRKLYEDFSISMDRFLSDWNERKPELVQALRIEQQQQQQHANLPSITADNSTSEHRGGPDVQKEKDVNVEIGEATLPVMARRDISDRSVLPAAPMKATTSTVAPTIPTTSRTASPSKLPLSETSSPFVQSIVVNRGGESVRYSSLSALEHKEYLEMRNELRNMKKKNIPIIPNARFIELKKRVEKEQADFKKMLYEEEMTLNRGNYHHMDPSVHEQVEKVIALKRSRIMSYPCYYKTSRVIDLTKIKAHPSDPLLRQEAVLGRYGKVHMFELEQLQNRVRISTDRAVYEVHHNATQSHHAPGERKHWKKRSNACPSRDMIAREMARQNGIDIVLSSSSFQAIVDLHEMTNFNEEWCIPVRVERLQSPIAPPAGTYAPDTSFRKVIFLDKPLLQKTLTTRQKNSMFYKWALTSAGMNLDSRSPVVDFDAINLQNMHAATVSSKASADSSDAETTEPQQIEQPKTNAETNMIPQTVQPAELPLNYPRVHDNLTYSLWTMGNMRILIRCKIHAMVEDKRLDNGVRFVGVSSKVEYHSHKNHEQDTLSEVSRWWAQTYIRPQTHLCIGRVDIFDSEISEIKKKSMSGIVGEESKFSPQHSMKRFFTALQCLMTLDPGQYLMAHRRYQSTIQVFESVQDERRSEYNLHEDYKNAGETDFKTAPYVPPLWRPIPNQIPYTFPIAPDSRHVQTQDTKRRTKKKKSKDRK